MNGYIYPVRSGLPFAMQRCHILGNKMLHILALHVMMRMVLLRSFCIWIWNVIAGCMHCSRACCATARAQEQGPIMLLSNALRNSPRAVCALCCPGENQRKPQQEQGVSAAGVLYGVCRCSESCGEDFVQVCAQGALSGTFFSPSVLFKTPGGSFHPQSFRARQISPRIPPSQGQ